MPFYEALVPLCAHFHARLASYRHAPSFQEDSRLSVAVSHGIAKGAGEGIAKVPELRPVAQRDPNCVRRRINQRDHHGGRGSPGRSGRSTREALSVSWRNRGASPATPRLPRNPASWRADWFLASTSRDGYGTSFVHSSRSGRKLPPSAGKGISRRLEKSRCN